MDVRGGARCVAESLLVVKTFGFRHQLWGFSRAYVITDRPDSSIFAMETQEGRRFREYSLACHPEGGLIYWKHRSLTGSYR